MQLLTLTNTRVGKSQYSETEAAAELGVSVGQLRTMIRSHVTDKDEDLSNVPVTQFHPSDLVILRMLAGLSQEVEAKAFADSR
ncbi:MAG: hypothetical protein ABI824_13830 [Acidobacteriota bacterium]